MKYLKIGIVLCIIFSTLPLLKPAPATEAQEAEAVTLIIWGEPGTAGCANDPTSTWEFCIYVREFNTQWEAQHPNIKLQWEDHSWDAELRDNVLAAVEEGNTPDIIVGEAFMSEYIAQDLLLPLDFTQEQIDNLIPATIQAVNANGQIYGVAAFTAIFTLEINADVFWIAGLNPDTVDLSTWDNVSETAAFITEAGNGAFYGFSILGPTFAPAAALFRVAPYIYQAGADFCNMPDCDTPTFNDPKAIPVYEWLRDLYQYTPPDLVFNGNEGYIFSQLFNGLTAMQTAGSWHISWGLGNGCQDCRYLPLPLPPDGTRANVVVGNATYSIMKDTAHPQEAQLFLEWLIDTDMQNNLFWTGVGGRLPTTYAAIERLEEIKDGNLDLVPTFYEELLGKDVNNAPTEVALYDVFIDELLNGDVRVLPPWKTNGTELNTLWNEMFTELLSSDQPVPEILDQYQAQAEAIIAAE